MLYRIAIFSNELKIKSLQDFVNYEINYFFNFDKNILKKFNPDIIILDTNKYSIELFNKNFNYIKKIILVDNLDKFDYLKNMHQNISSIISLSSINEQLNSACIKAIYELNLENSPKTIHLLDNLAYSIGKGIIYLENEQISLTSIQKKFFEYMLLKENYIVNYDEIIHEIWSNKIVTQSTLKNMVSFFNKIYPNLIINHYGIGYNLNFKQNNYSLNLKINYLEVLSNFLDKVFNFATIDKNVIQIALDEVLKIFKADRVCLCFPINLNSKYFYVEFYSFIEKFDPKTKDRIRLEMTKAQKVIMEKLLNSKEPLYLDENTLIPIIMEEYVFVESGHHPAKSILINHLKEKSGRNWAFAIHQCSFEKHYEDIELELFKKISEKILILLEMFMLNEKNKLEYINLEKILL